MCHSCDDNERTVSLLADLSRYVERPGADWEFADTVGFALAASLPILLDGPPDDFPGQEW